MYKVKEEIGLLDYLMQATNKKRNDLKNALKFKQVSVNGQIQSHYAYALHPGDVVEIGQKQSLPFTILYEDREIIVIDKPSGLVSEQTQNNKTKTAYAIVKDYLKSKHEKIYLVHRLDQETSGVLMFVKTKDLYQSLTTHWNDYVLKRHYYAIVEGKVTGHGTIENYLCENKAGKVYIGKQGGKKAITKYESCQSNGRYSLLSVEILTGRKNQIRVHLADVLGHPISGDLKYGGHRNTIHRLALHQDVFSFRHPISKKVMTFTSAMPADFKKLI